MPGAPRSVFVGGGIQPGTPFTLNSLLYITNITPPTASASVARQGTDGAVSYLTVGTGYVASPGATEEFRLKSGLITEGLGVDTLRIGRGASAGNAGNLRGIAIGTLANCATNDAVVIGYNASAATSGSVAVGYQAGAVLAEGITIGFSAYGQGNAGGATVIAIGTQANAQASAAGGQDALAIGGLAVARAYDTVIGYGAQSNVQSVFGNKNTVVGRQAKANIAQGNCVVVGADAAAHVLRGTAIGQLATAGSNDSIAIGQAASVGAASTFSISIGNTTTNAFAQSIVIGHGGVAFQANTAMIGGASTVINTLVIGSGNTLASPGAKSVRFTNATGVDNAAGEVVFTAPLSTGAAAEAGFAIAVGTVQAAGATQHVATKRLNFTPGAVVWNETVAPAGAAAVYATGSRGRHVFYGYPTTGDAMSFRQVVTGGAPGYIGYRADGTIAAPTALVAGDTILNVGGAGWDGTAWGIVTQGLMRVVAAENWGAAARGTKIEFRTTKNTTTAETTVVTFEHDGSVTMNPITAGTPAINLGANAQLGVAGAGAGTLLNLPAAVVAGDPAVYAVFNVNGVPTYFPGWQ